MLFTLGVLTGRLLSVYLFFIGKIQNARIGLRFVQKLQIHSFSQLFTKFSAPPNALLNPLKTNVNNLVITNQNATKSRIIFA